MRILVLSLAITSAAYAQAPRVTPVRGSLERRLAARRELFLRGMPRSTQPGSLVRRFAGTPLEGRVVAKTGSIYRVNTLSGYVERPDGRRITFSIVANSHAVPSRQILAQIDLIVVEIGKTR